MADGNGKKTVIMMSPDGKESWDIPEDQVQNALKLGAKMGPTPPPPTSAPGISSQVVSGLGKSVAEDVADPIAATGSWGLKSLADLAAGAATSITGIPAQLMRLGGGDPSKVVLFETGTPDGGKRPVTLASIGEAPDTVAGKIGSVVGDVAQLAIPSGWVKQAVLKSPKLLALGSKLMTKAAPVAKATEAGLGKYLLKEPLRYTGRAATGATTSGIQQASKTGDAEAAIKDAKTGAAIETALSLAGRGAKKTAKGFLLKAAKSVLPKKTIGEDYQEELANRLLETESDFSKKGVQAIEARFKKISDNMEKAADDADKWLEEASVLKHQQGMADPTGLIDASARIVDIRSKLADNWNKFKKQQGWDNLDDQEKRTLESLFSGFEKTLPQGGMQDLTFKEATENKKNFYLKLHQFYDKAKNPNFQVSESEHLKSKVRELFARSLKEGVQEGLEKLKYIRSQVNPPPGSMISKAEPWKIEVAPNQFADIKDAGLMAMRDADLAVIGKASRNASGPQASQATGEPLVTAVSFAQLMHGNIVTPSQVAALFYSLKQPTTTTEKIIPFLRYASTAKPPISSTARSAGVASAISERPTGQPPSMGGAQTQTQLSAGEFDAPLSK